MPDQVFCYHCHMPHPRDEMRLVETKTGRRWRCRRSIVAAKNGRAEREAFGRAVTEQHQAENRDRAKRVLNSNRLKP